MNNIIKLGLAIGAYNVILSLIALNFFPEKMFSPSWVTLVLLVLGILVAIFLGRYLLRGSNDSFLSYGSAAKKLLIAGLIGSLISTIVVAAIYNNNNDMKELFQKTSIEAQEKSIRWGMKMAGASEVEIESSIDDMQEGIESGEFPLPDYPYAWRKIPMTFVMAAFMVLIYALIAARWVREKESAQFT